MSDDYWKFLFERAERDNNWHKGLLYDAWRTMRGQTKGLQRQARLIKRLQAENARLRNNAEWVRATSAADGATAVQK